MFPAKQLHIQNLNIIARYIAPKSPTKPLVTQHYSRYLSKALSVREKMSCVITHFTFEDECRSRYYQDAVYGGSGIVLWEREVNNKSYKITLKASDLTFEGELSVLLTCDGCLLSLMSFSYIDKNIFCMRSGLSMLVTRNQTYNKGALSQSFYDEFKQNFPQYFCMAAIFGIARANNFRDIFAVKARAQVCHCENLGFENSYDAMWKSFNGAEHENVYLLNSVMDLKPISSVKRCHRKRAAQRRENWLEIIESSVLALHSTRK